MERSLHMIWPNIKIEVLGATRHTPAHLHHVCAADQKRNLGSMQRCHRSAMKLISAAFTLDGWNCPCCVCSHHSSITRGTRYTRACRERTLTRNVHPPPPFRFLKRWQNERCVSLRPRTFTTRNIPAEKCTMRLPRFRGAQTCCCCAAILPSTDYRKKRKNSLLIFAAP